MARPRDPAVADRRRRVAALAACGMPQPRIAAVLGVHVNTVARDLTDLRDDPDWGQETTIPAAATLGAIVATLPPAELRALGRALAGGEWDSTARRAAQRRLVDLIARR